DVLKGKKSTWICCKSQTLAPLSSTEDESSQETTTKEMFKQLLGKIAGLEAAVTFNGDVIEEIRTAFDSLKKENLILKRETDKLRMEVEKLKGEIWHNKKSNKCIKISCRCFRKKEECNVRNERQTRDNPGSTETGSQRETRRCEGKTDSNTKRSKAMSCLLFQ
ncbi:hypothetical protein WA026_016399, partial [Henosepilachna vigintioctopunctata]